MSGRSLLGLGMLLLLSAAIVFIFWQEELRYSLPTPIPKDYVSVSVNQKIALGITGLPTESPLYLHFYNPDCPCSRFNAKHIRDLIHSHGDRVKALIVVPSSHDKKVAHDEFGEALEIISDDDGTIAKSCGVYSTPQAVIIDRNGKLFYRGNYNRARYCTAQVTNYAEMALLSLINGANPPVFDLLATQSYGCQLPSTQTAIQF
jgi:AhpC/TSA family